ncbi:hypothetical protein HMN09_00583700 [Mycena chlorophos]|uniref:Uncharacterized protein n=1 Tax=Mycena chlorophos TaxID=658473 RepID=A0A8H6T4V3_MYCCL|nr:hypothetical protein HMN09_00583700 [Mycena chlorophos]
MLDCHHYATATHTNTSTNAEASSSSSSWGCWETEAWHRDPFRAYGKSFPPHRRSNSGSSTSSWAPTLAAISEEGIEPYSRTAVGSAAALEVLFSAFDDEDDDERELAEPCGRSVAAAMNFPELDNAPRGLLGRVKGTIKQRGSLNRFFKRVQPSRLAFSVNS